MLRLWSMNREQCEALYREAYERQDTDAKRWLATNDRYFLLTCVLRRPDCRHDWIFERCREVEADPDDNLDLWARDHYKSSIITFAGIIQEIIRDKEMTIGIFSHDRKAAKAFLRQIKLEFEENELLPELFPEAFWEDPKKQSPKWSEDEGIVCKRDGNPKEATLEAWGLVDGMPTGKHFKLRVYDDLVTEESVTTPDMIHKVTERWELSDNLGTRDGRVWYIGTRYHFADTYAIMIQRGVNERRYPATTDGSFDGSPVFLTDKQWERKLQLNSKPTIAAQQLLNPLAGSETTFDVRQLKTWEIRPKSLSVYIMVDPSKGKHASSDDTAISVIGLDANRNKYLLDGWRHRMNLSRRWILLRDMYKRWTRMTGIETVMVGYEQFGMQTDIEYFEERMLAEEFVFPIEELKWPRQGQNSKKHRIERLEPDFRSGRLRIPATIVFDEEGRETRIDPELCKAAQQCIEDNEKWRVAPSLLKADEDGKLYDLIDKFMEEFIFFPFAPKDDFLDATSRIYDMQAVPPVHYSDGPGGKMPLEPEVFVDGI